MRPWELHAIKMSFSSPTLIGCFISAPPPLACSNPQTPFIPVLGWGGYMTQQKATTLHTHIAQISIEVSATNQISYFPCPYVLFFCTKNTIATISICLLIEGSAKLMRVTHHRKISRFCNRQQSPDFLMVLKIILPDLCDCGVTYVKSVLFKSADLAWM